MGSARAILVFAWAIGTLGIAASGWIWGKPFVHRIRLGIFASAVLGLALFGLDAWTVKHRHGEFSGILKPNVLLSSKAMARVVQIGPSGAVLNIDGPNADLFSKLLGESRLVIEQVDGALKVSTVIRNVHGDVVAVLNRNEWEVANRPESWDRNYTSDTLEVQDNAGDIVLQVKVLSDRIQLQGKWYYSDAKRTVLMQPACYPGYVMIHFAEGTRIPDPHEVIEPLLQFPSLGRIGQLRPVLLKIVPVADKENKRLGDSYETAYVVSVLTREPIPNLIIRLEGRTLVRMEISPEYNSVEYGASDGLVARRIQDAFGTYIVRGITRGPDRLYIFHEP
jgi:hypothetical protein